MLKWKFKNEEENKYNSSRSRERRGEKKRNEGERGDETVAPVGLEMNGIPALLPKQMHPICCPRSLLGVWLELLKVSKRFIQLRPDNNTKFNALREKRETLKEIPSSLSPSSIYPSIYLSLPSLPPLYIFPILTWIHATKFWFMWVFRFTDGRIVMTVCYDNL